jgi:hypothetical protein
MIVGFRLLFYNVLLLQLWRRNQLPVLKGKVNAVNVDGIYVINLTTEKSVITDVEGYFGIKGRGYFVAVSGAV